MRRRVFYFGPSGHPCHVHGDPGLPEISFVKNEIGAPHAAIALLLPFSWKPASKADGGAALSYETINAGEWDLLAARDEGVVKTRAAMRQIARAGLPRVLLVTLLSEDMPCTHPVAGAARIPAVRLAWAAEVGAAPLTLAQAKELLRPLGEVLWTAEDGAQVLPMWAVPACMRQWGHPERDVQAWRAHVQCQLQSRMAAYPDGLAELGRLK